MQPIFITAWFYIILCSHRHPFFALHAVVVNTCVCTANQDSDLWGECSKMAPILKCFSSASTVLCLAYFLFKKDLAESNFFTNSKITDHSTPGYLWRNLLLHDLFYLLFHIHIAKNNPLFKLCFTISIQYCERCLNVLIEKKHTKY
jgi:hypothetical protein